MEINKLIRWLMKMKISGTKEIKINNNNIECYNDSNEKLGSIKGV